MDPLDILIALCGALLYGLMFAGVLMFILGIGFIVLDSNYSRGIENLVFGIVLYYAARYSARHLGDILDNF